MLKIPILQNSSKSDKGKVFVQKCHSGEYVLKTEPCPICGKMDYEIFGMGDIVDFEWGICRNCGLIGIVKKLENRCLDTFYTSGEYQEICMGGLDARRNFELEYKVMSLYFINIIQEVLRQNITKKCGGGISICEIGCGSGGIMLAFKEEGFRVKGFDLDPVKIEYGKKYVDNIKCADAMAVGNLKEWDFILLSNVLEHLYHPRSVLEKLHEVIADDAYVIIAVPNVERISEYGNKVEKFFHIAHLWYFSPSSLERILNECGFKIEYIQCIGAAMTVVVKKSKKKLNNKYNSYWISKGALAHAQVELNSDSIKYHALNVYDNIIHERK